MSEQIEVIYFWPFDRDNRIDAYGHDDTGAHRKVCCERTDLGTPFTTDIIQVIICASENARFMQMQLRKPGPSKILQVSRNAFLQFCRENHSDEFNEAVELSRHPYVT